MVRELFLDYNELKELMKWHSDKGILSIYLSFEERDKSAVQRWKSLVRSNLGTLGEARLNDKNLQKAIDKAQETLLELPVEMRKRSLVYFHNLSNGEVFMKSLQMPLPNRCVWMSTAFLRPLVAMLDEYPTLGIVVLSKELIRVLTWKQGIIDESFERKIHIDYEMDEEARPQNYGMLSGVQSDAYTQKVEMHIKKIMVDSTAQILKMAAENRWQSILLTGSPKFTDAVEENMPNEWQYKVIGKIDKNYINSTILQIADNTTTLLGTWKRKIEEELVSFLLETNKAGGKAVLGVQKTIDALEQYRVEHLLFLSDIQIEGYIDEDGSILTGITVEEAEGLTVEPQVIERIIEMAFESGARVTPLDVHDSAEFVEAGGVGAILRY